MIETTHYVTTANASGITPLGRPAMKATPPKLVFCWLVNWVVCYDDISSILLICLVSSSS